MLHKQLSSMAYKILPGRCRRSVVGRMSCCRSVDNWGSQHNNETGSKLVDPEVIRKLPRVCIMYTTNNFGRIQLELLLIPLYIYFLSVKYRGDTHRFAISVEYLSDITLNLIKIVCWPQTRNFILPGNNILTSETNYILVTNFGTGTNFNHRSHFGLCSFMHVLNFHASSSVPNIFFASGSLNLATAKTLTRARN